MPVDVRVDAKPGETITKSRGNGWGKPIIPVLMAVAIVAVFIVIYRIGTGQKNAIESGTMGQRFTGTYQVPYQVDSTATTATGQDVRGLPMRTGQPTNMTSTASSSSMPMQAAPMRASDGSLLGHNWIAPPDPVVVRITQPDNTGSTSTMSTGTMNP